MSNANAEHVPAQASGNAGSSRASWMIRRLPLLFFVVIVAIGLFVYFWLQPTELEREIRLDLIAKEVLGESARVRVLEQTDLVTFHHQQFRKRFAIICVQDGSQLHLGQAVCHRPGAVWNSNSAEWLSLKSWPSVELRQKYKKEQAHQLLPSLLGGYLPRPADKTSFQVELLSIQVSEDIEGLDPNHGIDHTLLAHLLKSEVQYTAKSHLNRFTFAPFHEPRWFEPEIGIAEIAEYIEMLQHRRGRNELPTDESESMIRMLQATTDQLKEIEARGLKFHFLALQHEPE